MEIAIEKPSVASGMHLFLTQFDPLVPNRWLTNWTAPYLPHHGKRCQVPRSLALEAAWISCPIAPRAIWPGRPVWDWFAGLSSTKFLWLAYWFHVGFPFQWGYIRIIHFNGIFHEVNHLHFHVFQPHPSWFPWLLLLAMTSPCAARRCCAAWRRESPSSARRCWKVCGAPAGGVVKFWKIFYKFLEWNDVAEDFTLFILVSL